MNENILKYHINMMRFHLDFAKNWIFLVESGDSDIPALDKKARDMFFYEAQQHIKKVKYNLLIIETMEYNYHG